MQLLFRATEAILPGTVHIYYFIQTSFSVHSHSLMMNNYDAIVSDTSSIAPYITHLLLL